MVIGKSFRARVGKGQAARSRFRHIETGPAALSPSFQKHQPLLSHLLQFSSTASTNVIVVELQVVLDIPPLSSHPLLYTSNPAHSKLQHKQKCSIASLRLANFP
jgi:hypothetical protein